MHKLRYWVCVFVLFVAAKLQAQEMYSLAISQSSKLTHILDQLNQKYHLNFAYPTQAISEEQIAPIAIHTSDLQDLLTQLLKNSAIDFQITGDKQVLLKKIENYQRDYLQTKTLEIQGNILDEETKTPLSYAAVYVDSLFLGIQTDEKGEFVLHIPTQYRYRDLCIRMIGYETVKRNIQDCLEQFTVLLPQAPLRVEGITIEDRVPTVAVNTTEQFLQINSFSQSFASTLTSNDPLRTLQLLPGINSSDDLSAEIEIRGSQSDATLIVLDGIPIYKATHFYGVFSAINGDYIDNIGLYKNTLPIQYGGRTGGLLLMQSEDEIDQWHAEADVNLLTSSLTLQIPLSKKTSLSIGGRTTYQNVAETNFFNSVSGNSQNILDNIQFQDSLVQALPNFRFHDANAKLIYTPNDRQKLALNFFHSKDRYTYDYDLSFEESQDINLNERRVLVEQGYSQDENWQNMGTSFQYQVWGDQWEIDLQAYYTSYTSQADLSLVSTYEGRNQLWTFEQNNFQQNQMRDIGGKAILNYNWNANQSLQMGLETVNHYNQFHFEVDTRREQDHITQGAVHTSFINYRWAKPQKWEISIGNRINYYDVTQKFYLSPRFSANYSLGSYFSLKGALSRDNQFVRNITQDNPLTQNYDAFLLSDGITYPVAFANNFMIGANYQKNNWTWDIEGFYKTMSNVIEHTSSIVIESIQGDALTVPNGLGILSGRGTTYGMDVLLHYHSSRYRSWVSYTLSKSTRSFEEVFDNKPFPALDDRRHQLKWINTAEWKNFHFSANFVYSSGPPRADIRRMITRSSLRNQNYFDKLDRLPSYQRLDLGVGYQIPLASSSLRIDLSAINSLNRNNVKYLYNIGINQSATSQQSISNFVLGNQTPLLDRTLNLSLRWDF